MAIKHFRWARSCRLKNATDDSYKERLAASYRDELAPSPRNGAFTLLMGKEGHERKQLFAVFRKFGVIHAIGEERNQREESETEDMPPESEEELVLNPPSDDSLISDGAR